MDYDYTPKMEVSENFLKDNKNKKLKRRKQIQKHKRWNDRSCGSLSISQINNIYQCKCPNYLNMFPAQVYNMLKQGNFQKKQFIWFQLLHASNWFEFDSTMIRYFVKNDMSKWNVVLHNSQDHWKVKIFDKTDPENYHITVRSSLKPSRIEDPYFILQDLEIRRDILSFEKKLLENPDCEIARGWFQMNDETDKKVTFMDNIKNLISLPTKITNGVDDVSKFTKVATDSAENINSKLNSFSEQLYNIKNNFSAYATDLQNKILGWLESMKDSIKAVGGNIVSFIDIATTLAALYHVLFNPSNSAKLLGISCIVSFMARNYQNVPFSINPETTNVTEDSNFSTLLWLPKLICSIVSQLLNIDVNFMLQKLALLGHACLGITRIVELVSKIVSYIYDWIFEWYHGYSPNFVASIAEKWVKDAIALSDTKAKSNLINLKLEQLYRTGSRLWAEVRDPRLKASIKIVLERVKQATTADARSAFEGGMRKSPFCIYLYGESNVQKSTFAQKIGSQITQTCLGVDYEEASQEVVSLNLLANFLDNYRNQFCVILDDVGQSRDTDAKPSMEYLYLIQMINMVAFCVDKAAVEEKGRCYFTSPLIFATSNFQPGALVIQSLTYRRALERRFNLIVKVEMNEGVQQFRVEACNNCIMSSVDSILTQEEFTTYAFAQFLLFHNRQSHILKEIASAKAPPLPLTKRWDMNTLYEAVFKSKGITDKEFAQLMKESENWAIDTLKLYDEQMIDARTTLLVDDKTHERFPCLQEFKDTSGRLCFREVDVTSIRSELRIIKAETILKVLKENNCEVDSYIGDNLVKKIEKYKDVQPDPKEEAEDSEEEVDLDLLYDPSYDKYESLYEHLHGEQALVNHYEDCHLYLRPGQHIAYPCLICVDPNRKQIYGSFADYQVDLGKIAVIKQIVSFPPIVKVKIPKQHVAAVKYICNYVKKTQPYWTIVSALFGGMIAAFSLAWYFRETDKLIQGEMQQSSPNIRASGRRPQVTVHQGLTQDSQTVEYGDEWKVHDSTLVQYLPKTDGNALQLVDKLLVNSCTITRIRDDMYTELLTGCMMNNNCLLTCRHILTRLDVGDLVLLRFSGGVTHTYKFSSLQIEFYEYDGKREDAIIIRLPRPLNGFKKVYQHFCSMSSQMALQPRCIMLVGKSFRQDDDVNIIHTSERYDFLKDQYIYGQTIDGREVTYTALRYYRYIIPTRNGDCAQLLIANDPGYTKKILGMHVSRSNDGFGISMVFDGPTLEALITKGDNVITDERFSMPVQPCHGVVQMNDKEEILMESPTVLKGQFLNIGVGLWTPPPCQNQFYYSPLRKWHGRPLTRQPAVMNKVEVNGVMVDPLFKAVEKMGLPEYFIDNRYLDDSTYDYFATINSHFTKVRKKILTVEEAVFGDPNDKFIRSINVASSPGLPYILMQPQGMKGKKHWVNLDSKYIDPVLLTMIKRRMSGAYSGVLYETIWLDLSKSEKRSIEKVKEASTRLYSCGPMCFNIVIRMFFGSFVSYMMHNRIGNESAVGINPYSQEWGQLSAHLLKRGPKVVAGDFSKFDGSLVLQILWKCLDVINMWYDDGPSNFVARRNLFSQMMSSTHYVKGIMYTVHHSNPSGNPLTAILNTMYNSIVSRYIFCTVMASSTVNPIRLFRVNVSMIAYGDDNVYNITDAIYDKFNQLSMTEAFKEIGMTYTSADKTVFTDKVCSLRDITFLKRGFVYDDEYALWCAPLDEDVILETPCFERRNLNDEEFSNMITNVIHEMALHGSTFYYEWGKKLISAATDVRPTVYLKYPSHESCMEEVRSGSFDPTEEDY